MDFCGKELVLRKVPMLGFMGGSLEIPCITYFYIDLGHGQDSFRKTDCDFLQQGGFLYLNPSNQPLCTGASKD